MRSRYVKLTLALLVLGLGVFFVVSAASAEPKILDLRILGFGTVGGTCQISFVAGCTSNSSGEVLGTHVGFGVYGLTLTAGANFGDESNASGGKCLPANNLLADTIIAANGDMINYRSVGWLCEEFTAGTSYHYNGTYRILGGTGRFSGAVGGGNVAATFEKCAPPCLTGPTFIKFDGTIRY